MVENENLINNSIQTNLNIDEDQINVCNEITSIENNFRLDKVVIQLKAAGNAPILKNNKIKLNGTNTIAKLYEFLRQQLKTVIKDNESIYIYCNNNFAPSPNYFLADLYKSYQVQGELIIYYALTEAWG